VLVEKLGDQLAPNWTSFGILHRCSISSTQSYRFIWSKSIFADQLLGLLVGTQSCLIVLLPLSLHISSLLCTSTFSFRHGLWSWSNRGQHCISRRLGRSCQLMRKVDFGIRLGRDIHIETLSTNYRLRIKFSHLMYY
jgi:hypothetical protein